MTRVLQKYSPEIEKGLYSIFVATIKNIDPWGKDKDISKKSQLDMV